MKLQPLYDLQQDVNRLFIAGSKYAKDDLKLQKHVPVFNKLGEKAPVFAKLAADIEELVNTDPQQSASKLTAISTLLYSILYTQGETFEEDKEISEQAPLMNINDVNTKFTYKQLHQFIELLSLRRSDGRYNIIKEAKETGLFSDSRTYWYVDYALNDEYGLAFSVEDEIPAIGKSMLPFLLRSFRYEDKKRHAGRLRLIEELGHPDVPVIINRILLEPLPKLQVEALNILSKDPANEEVIATLIEDKDDDVCKAVYKALFSIGTKTAMERLKDALANLKNKYPKLKKGYWQIKNLVDVLASSKLPYLLEDFLALTEEAYEDIFVKDKKGGKKLLEAKNELFYQMMDIFKKEDDELIDDFYVRVLGDEKYFELGWGRGATESISSALSLRGSERAVAFYERNIDKMADSVFAKKMWVSWLDELYKTYESKERQTYDKRRYIIQLDTYDFNPNKFYRLLDSVIRYSHYKVLILVFKYAMKYDVCDKFKVIFYGLAKFKKNGDYDELFSYFSNTGFWSQFPAEYEEEARQLSERFRKMDEVKKQEAFSSIADEIQMRNNSEEVEELDVDGLLRRATSMLIESYPDYLRNAVSLYNQVLEYVEKRMPDNTTQQVAALCGKVYAYSFLISLHQAKFSAQYLKDITLDLLTTARKVIDIAEKQPGMYSTWIEGLKLDVFIRATNWIGWHYVKNPVKDMDTMNTIIDIVQWGINEVEALGHYYIYDTMVCLLLKVNRQDEAYTIVRYCLEKHPKFEDFQHFKKDEKYLKWIEEN